MTTTKQEAQGRVRSRYIEFVKKREVSEQKAAESEREKMHYKAMISTEGWKLLYPAMEKKIQELQTELFETSSFRVFKCMELRAEIKSIKNLYIIMSRAEKLGLLFSVRD